MKQTDAYRERYATKRGPEDRKLFVIVRKLTTMRFEKRNIP